MMTFAAAWPDLEFAQQPAAQLGGAGITQQPAAQIGQPETARQAGAPFAQAPVAQLPWFHHCILLDKLETPEDRLWYAAKAVEHGWSRNGLALQIESGLHRRQGKAVSNFKTTLPPVQSDLAQGITKDPYLFDFLTRRDAANERAVEEGLLAQVEKFLLELGAGFALVGRQHAVTRTSRLNSTKPRQESSKTCGRFLKSLRRGKRDCVLRAEISAAR